jgi:hypothetical protein
MAIGCIPWAILAGWLGYRLSLNFVLRHRESRKIRRRKHKQKGQPAGEPTLS